jgi:hypothetical protein
MSSCTLARRIPFSYDRGGHRPLFAQDAEQQVLGADVGVQQPVVLFGRKLQDTLRLRAERDVDGGRHLLAEDRAAFNLLADAFEDRCDRAKMQLVRPFRRISPRSKCSVSIEVLPSCVAS